MATRYRAADWRPADLRVYVSDIQHAGTKLAWEPKVGPIEGVHRLLAWISTQMPGKPGKSGAFERPS